MSIDITLHQSTSQIGTSITTTAATAVATDQKSLQFTFDRKNIGFQSGDLGIQIRGFSDELIFLFLKLLVGSCQRVHSLHFPQQLRVLRCRFDVNLLTWKTETTSTTASIETQNVTAAPSSLQS